MNSGFTSNEGDIMMEVLISDNESQVFFCRAHEDLEAAVNQFASRFQLSPEKRKALLESLQAYRTSNDFPNRLEYNSMQYDLPPSNLMQSAHNNQAFYSPGPKYQDLDLRKYVESQKRGVGSNVIPTNRNRIAQNGNLPSFPLDARNSNSLYEAGFSNLNSQSPYPGFKQQFSSSAGNSRLGSEEVLVESGGRSGVNQNLYYQPQTTQNFAQTQNQLLPGQTVTVETFEGSRVDTPVSGMVNLTQNPYAQGPQGQILTEKTVIQGGNPQLSGKIRASSPRTPADRIPTIYSPNETPGVSREQLNLVAYTAERILRASAEKNPNHRLYRPNAFSPPPMAPLQAVPPQVQPGFVNTQTIQTETFTQSNAGPFQQNNIFSNIDPPQVNLSDSKSFFGISESDSTISFQPNDRARADSPYLRIVFIRSLKQCHRSFVI